MKPLLALLCFLFFQNTFAQTEQNDLSVHLGAVTIPSFDQHKIGVDISFRYYFTDAFSGGLGFSTASPRFNKGFGFDTDRTLVNMYAITIPMQYDVINTEKFSLGLGFSNGLLLNILRNRNETTEQEHWDPDTGIGTSWNVPKRLKTDSYYILTPYAEASYKLFTIDSNDPTFLFLTGKIGYQNVFGNGQFSKSNDFRNYILSLGLTIKGPL